MRLRLIVPALVVLIAPLLAGPAPASAAVSWVERDAANDVRILAGGTLTEAERRTIDLRWVRARTTASGGTKFVVRIADVRPRADYDQMVFISARPLPGRGSFPRLDAGWSPQVPDLGYATRFPRPGRYVNCDPLAPPVVNTARDTIAQVVPNRCLPRGRMRVTVTTVTGTFRSEGASSEDVVRFRRALR